MIWQAGKIINTCGLKFLGGGVTGNVYRLNEKYVVKVYCNASTWYCKDNSDMIALMQELEACYSSDLVLPIEDIAIARKRNKLYYAAIKRYLPYRCSYTEVSRIERLLPMKLRWDLHEGNVMRDYNGKLWLIDCHLESEKYD